MGQFLNWLQSLMPDAAAQAAFVAFYGQNMRASMFTGFLTLSGFLLSAMTFVIIQMKKEVYEKDSYLQRVKDMRGAGLTKGHVYGPLRNLSRAMTASIVVSLVASISQMTLGLVDSYGAAATCYAIAILAMIFLGFSLFLICLNLRTWFGDLDTEAEIIIKRFAAESQATNATAASP